MAAPLVVMTGLDKMVTFVASPIPPALLLLTSLVWGTLMRTTLIGLVLAGGALVTTPALAADFSKVRCESPAFQKFIVTRLPKMHAIQATRSAGDRFTGARIAGASTVSASSDEVVCAVTLNIGPAGRPVHGRFTLQQMADGRNNWKWLPGY